METMVSWGRGGSGFGGAWWFSGALAPRKSFPAALPWQNKAVIFQIPGPETGTRAHSPKPFFYRTAFCFLSTLSRQILLRRAIALCFHVSHPYPIIALHATKRAYCTPLALSVPKNRNRRKIAAFSNRKVLNRRFCRRNRRKIARKSQKKSQKNR